MKYVLVNYAKVINNQRPPISVSSPTVGFHPVGGGGGQGEASPPPKNLALIKLSIIILLH